MNNLLDEVEQMAKQTAEQGEGSDAKGRPEFHVLIWADIPERALHAAEVIAAETGGRVGIRDASEFDRRDVEPCLVTAFLGAGRRDEIIGCYTGPSYRGQYPEPQVWDIDGQGKRCDGKPASINDPVTEPKADALDEQTAQMSDDDLSTFISGCTGARPDAAIGRDKMLQLLRDHRAGRKTAEAEISPAGSAGVADDGKSTK